MNFQKKSIKYSRPHTINNTYFLSNHDHSQFKKTDTWCKTAYYPRIQTYFYSCKLLHMQNSNELTLTLATHSAINVLYFYHTSSNYNMRKLTNVNKNTPKINTSTLDSSIYQFIYIYIYIYIYIDSSIYQFIYIYICIYICIYIYIYIYIVRLSGWLSHISFYLPT